MDPPLQWGDQTHIRPIPPSAFTYEPSLRIIDLAQPKQVINPERSLPRGAGWKVSHAARTFRLTKEVDSLAVHKHHRRCHDESPHHSFLGKPRYGDDLFDTYDIQKQEGQPTLEPKVAKKSV